VIRGDGFAVVDAGDGATARTTIDASTGCRNLVQRVLEIHASVDYGPTSGSEEVGYVVAGTGALTSAGPALRLEPGTGFLVPPGTPYALVPDGGPMTIVSVVCPPPGRPGAPRERPGDCVTVLEADREPLPAGEDRFFKVLVDPSVGCRGVTQFVGFIEESRAPEHVHTYEEVIHVLDGGGLLHAAGERVPFGPGSSIFLAPGTPHCLENTGRETLRLLGVFSPAGSPADKREQWTNGGVT
jgi:mannose-6-phosphate isomerase-like protein (cupin superfamily)